MNRLGGRLLAAVVAAGLVLLPVPLYAQVEPAPAPVLDAVPGTAPDPPAVTAAAWVLMDVGSGQVLAGAAIDEPRPVASTIKLLTALTVIERADLDDQVVVSAGVSAGGGAGTSVDPGETRTVRQLLEALLVRSGNDAAEALAVHVGGSVEAFVGLMREDADALGISPVLSTPSGLDDANRLSARDVATVARAFAFYPQLMEIAGLASVTLPDVGAVPNRNLLLEQYDDATGLKTGFTTASGYSVVGTAERDGRAVLAVVLGADSAQSRFDDAIALLDHGFDAFDQVRVGRSALVRAGGEWVDVGTGPAWVSVLAGTDVTVDWSLPRRVTEAGPVTVRIPRVDAFEIASTPVGDPSPPPSVGAWVRDRLHEALRTFAATGPPA